MTCTKVKKTPIDGAGALNIYRIKSQSGFDPGSPWTLSLTVGYGNNPWLAKVSPPYSL